MWAVCEFYGSNGNGFGDIWWTDNPIYFSSIDERVLHLMTPFTGIDDRNNIMETLAKYVKSIFCIKKSCINSIVI